jgi:hypothetical protein
MKSLFTNEYKSDGKMWNVDKVIDDINTKFIVNNNIKYSIYINHINDYDLVYIVSLFNNIEFIIHCNYETDEYNVLINKSSFIDLELYMLCELALKDMIRMNN